MKKIFLLLYCFSISYGQQKIKFSELQLIGMSEISMIKNQEFQLLPQAANSFELMKKAALKDSVNIKIVSSFRCFDQQKKIWNRKFEKNNSLGLSKIENIFKIIEYSTIPGTSRHHWGTEIDIIDGNINPEGDVLLSEKFYDNGPYVRLKKWLDNNSEEFGFYLVYTNNNARKGFKHEPWHYSYAPLSIPIMNDFLDLDLIHVFSKYNINGSSSFTNDFINLYKENFLLGINPDLKKEWN
ncbi:MAG: M15 family metallopeptidase [Flavobacteriaceae bacterium]|nr:M15 family metallopeptidase [Flavobacteriaceae bacterium]